MKGFDDIINMKLSRLQESSDTWNKVANQLQVEFEENDRKSRELDGLNPPWTGEAADMAHDAYEEAVLDLEAVRIEVAALRTFLDDMIGGQGDEWGTNLKQLQEDAVALASEASVDGMKILNDGSVKWTAVNSSPAAYRLAEKADAIEEKAKGIVKKARELDDSMTRALKNIFGTSETFRTENRNRVEPEEATDEDRARASFVVGMIRSALVLLYKWVDAASLLKHYVDGNGAPYNIDATRMMSEIPDFKSSVNDRLSGTLKDAPDGPFETEWVPTLATHTDNLNWYYALHHFQYRIVGEKHDGQITYHVEVFKRYDWGTPSEHRRDLNIPDWPILEKIPDIEQAKLARLNYVGLAKDFDVHGKTGSMTYPS